MMNYRLWRRASDRCRMNAFRSNIQPLKEQNTQVPIPIIQLEVTKILHKMPQDLVVPILLTFLILQS